MIKKWCVLLLVVVMIAQGCAKKDDGAWRAEFKNADVLHKSVKQVTDIIVHDIFSPPVASRIYTYMTVAAYEAALPGYPEYTSLAGQLHGLTEVPRPDSKLEYCFELASMQAALKVGKTLVFSEKEMQAYIDQVMADYHKTGIPDEIFERSIEYGNAVADHIIKWSSTDNYKQTRSFPKYTVKADEGFSWKPTPPAYMEAVEPHWNKIRTFVLDSAGQFKPAPATAFSIEKNSQFYKEAMEVHDIGKNISDEQLKIAMFWDCNPFTMNVKGHVMFATKKISPGGHWMNITHVACKKGNIGFMQSAEAYTRVALALNEGFISCWDEKYRSKLIRPETYINQYINEDWVPVLQTPPFPEYTSGHSVISSASAVTLTRLFGENFTFTDSTEIEFGMPARSFTSFIQASEEAAISRLYGGIHYRPAVEQGMVEGRALGNWVYDAVKTRETSLANAK
jgi:hypothetical protein